MNLKNRLTKWAVGFMLSCWPYLALAQDSAPDLGAKIREYYNISIKLGFPIGVVIIIYAGYLYITSTGNPETIGQAKQLLVGAISGLIVLILAGLILGSQGIIESRV